MSKAALPEQLLLAANPFEPAATGAPLYGALRPPKRLEDETRRIFDGHGTGPGVKSIVVVGEYGTGKSCLLRWLHRDYCREHQIRSFYFDNPGVYFYDLANALLRTLGRKDFAKSIWELAGQYVVIDGQRTLFDQSFENFLDYLSRSRSKQEGPATALQDAVRTAGLAQDEQVARCLARIVTEVVRKPYFEYRDFVPRRTGSIVPENEEAPYFRSILKTIQEASAARGVAFLIDEFEEIGLQRRLTQRAARDYLATMKRLVNLSQSNGLDFWIVLSMTPDAFEMTTELDPALMERVAKTEIEIGPLSATDAQGLVRERVRPVRSCRGEAGPEVPDLFPFPQQLPFSEGVMSNPRKLVKICFRALADSDASTTVPFENDYLLRIQKQMYPSADESD